MAVRRTKKVALANGPGRGDPGEALSCDRHPIFQVSQPRARASPRSSAPIGFVSRRPLGGLRLPMAAILSRVAAKTCRHNADCTALLAADHTSALCPGRRFATPSRLVAKVARPQIGAIE